MDEYSEGARTSSTHPLDISEIPVGPGQGRLGITFAPGKKQDGAMSGHWNRDLSLDLDAIAEWDAAAVLTLIEDHEFTPLGISKLGPEVRRRHMEWHHCPIMDFGVPDSTFEKTWPAKSQALRNLLGSGASVLVHCKGGLGRAGMVGARLLVEAGWPGDLAISQVRSVRPGSIETAAQENWVRQGHAVAPVTSSTSVEACLDRALGAMLGLAVGDAVGTTLEFAAKPAFVVLDDMVGGGPFALRPGQWTDDTAMALALADSLLAHDPFDPRDLMERFTSWYRMGAYSCTGACFDIGNTVRAALARFEKDGNPVAGSTSANTAGNGALMRLAPVAIRRWNQPALRRSVAIEQTRTTHGAAEAVSASVAFADVLAAAISGMDRESVLGSLEGSLQRAPRSAVRGTGYVVDCLEAAGWAVARTTSFRSAVLLAANLGDDADTTAAVAGQLAGALYGAAAIPSAWLDKLAWRIRLRDTAQRLFEHATGR